MTRSDLLALRHAMYAASRAFNQTQQAYWVGTPDAQALKANEAAAARLATALTTLLAYLGDDLHHAAERARVERMQVTLQRERALIKERARQAGLTDG